MCRFAQMQISGYNRLVGDHMSTNCVLHGRLFQKRCKHHRAGIF